MADIGEFYLLNDKVSLVLLRQTITGIEPRGGLPITLSLLPNYPNPFNAGTTISYSLPENSVVTLDIYDILGRKIQTLFEGNQPAGNHSLIWNADNFSSGVYFYKLTSGEMQLSNKMILIK